MACFASIVRTDNIGDLVACPADYFPQFSGVLRLDIRDYEGGEVVFGGGGLCHPGVDRLMALAPPARAIVWGAGTNYHNVVRPLYPECFKQFALVGLRDRDNPWVYVPCPSCLHPVFDERFPEPVHACVAYVHHEHALDLPAMPVRVNRGTKEDFPDVIRFLASGRMIVTNTYHGAYWGQLLRRRTVIVNPFSNRFYWMRHQPPIANEGTWQVQGAQARVVDGFLESCRAINRAFAQVVVATLTSCE